MTSKKAHEKLEEVIKSLDKDKPLNIFMHNQPDPDTMACALALDKIASHYNKRCAIYYSQESDFLMNKRTINILNLQFTRIDPLSRPEELIKSMDYIALVDVGNNEKLKYHELLEDKVVIDIDHHNSVKSSDDSGRFIYKKSAGACISFLIDWIKSMDLKLDSEIDKQLILSSYLGLKVDTSSFARKSMEKIDRDAKRYIEQFITEADYELLSTIENPEIPLIWSKKLGEVLTSFPATGSSNLFYKGIGVVGETGVVPYIAEDISRRRNFGTVIIYGLCYKLVEENKYTDLKIKAAGRSNDNSINLCEIFSDVFYKRNEDGKKIYHGGGRKCTGGLTYYAGADIPLEEEGELSIDRLGLLYNIWESKINKRIETKFLKNSI